MQFTLIVFILLCAECVCVVVQNYQSSSNGQYLAYSMNNTIYVSDNSGSCWSKVPGPAEVNGGIAISDAGDKLFFFYCQGNPNFYTTTRNGQIYEDWTSLSINSFPHFCGSGTCAFGRSLQYGYCFGSMSNIYYTADYGTTWSQASTPEGINYYGWNGADDSGQYAVVAAFGYGAYVTQNYGQSWNHISLAQSSICGVTVSGNGQYMYAVSGAQSSGYNGYIFYSSNYGISWSQCSNVVPQNYQNIVSSYTGQYVIATFWEATIYYLSNSYGSSWALKHAPNAQNILFTSNRWISISADVLYSSVDNGESWTDQVISICKENGGGEGKTCNNVASMLREMNQTMNALKKEISVIKSKLNMMSLDSSGPSPSNYPTTMTRKRHPVSKAPWQTD